MAEVTEQQIVEALRQVFDPDKKADIVTLGMVSGIAVKNGHVAFAIEVEASRGPSLEPLRKAAEKVVEGLGGVVSVSAVLTAERNVQGGPKGGGHGHAHGHGAQQPEAPLLPHVKAIIAVASGKGGVGKSTTATNLALALSRLGLSVGLFDADIFGPSMPRMLGISGEPVSPDGQTLLPMENYGIKCMSMGFLVPQDSPIIWRGPMVMGALEQLLRDVQWGELDVMVIDMPPGTGDTQLTITQRLPLTGAIIVSTPQDIALLDATKGLNMFRKVDVPVLGLIENMSYYICPKCGDEAHIFGHGGAKAEAARLSADFLGEVPLDIAIRQTSDAGEPIVISKPNSPHAKVYMEIARKVWDKVQLLQGAGGRKGPRIVME